MPQTYDKIKLRISYHIVILQNCFVTLFIFIIVNKLFYAWQYGLSEMWSVKVTILVRRNTKSWSFDWFNKDITTHVNTTAVPLHGEQIRLTAQTSEGKIQWFSSCATRKLLNKIISYMMLI